MSQIPDLFETLPKGVIARNPFDLYASLYEFGWWKSNPYGNTEKIKNDFPSYPNLNFREFVKYKNKYGVEALLKGTILEEYDVSEIGYHSINYIFTLFIAPKMFCVI